MNANEAILLWADEYSRMAETYDRLVVPRFEPVARVVTDLAGPKPGELFLDLGTGTGLLARLLSPRVAPQGVVAIDLADGAISVGSYRAGDAGIRNIRFEMMDCRNIVYRGKLFDGVVSNFGVPELGYDRTFAEVRRVLKPEGRFVFSEWDAALPEGSALLSSLVAKHGTRTPSRQLAALREAHALATSSEEARATGDPAAVARALGAAGFARADVLSRAFPVPFASVDEFVALEAAWGRTDRELAEMPPDARRAFNAELEDGLRSRLGPTPFEESWRVNVFAARQE
ncbi:MAG: class I SAM-dependent methyltransferase [Methanobacteriota archaeon]